MTYKQKQYLVYNPAGLEWVEQLPACWEVLRLKDIIEVLESGVSVNASDVPVEGDSVGVLKTSCVGKSQFLPSMNKSVWETEVTKVKTPVKGGRIIVSRMNTPDLVGASAYIPQDYPNLFLPDRLWQTVFYKNSKHDTKWLSYLIGSSVFRFLLSKLATGTSPSMKNLGQDKFLAIVIPFPTPFEQQKIAAYLDIKTDLIDYKIDLLTKKAERYEILKQSLINETVTRGLNKTAAMKDSGIKWIGNVPSHWDCERLKDYASQSKEKNGLNPIGNMLSVSGYRGIEVKEYDSEEKMRTNEELSDYRAVRPGQLVVNTMWLNYRGIGVSNHIGYVSPAYRAYYLSKKIIGGYLHYLMRSDLYVSGYSAYLQGIRPNSLQMKTIDFESLPLLVPPSNEQKAIADYLDDKTAKIDEIVLTINQQIENLKELRKTLINDVVTGKLKVTQDDNNEGLAA